MNITSNRLDTDRQLLDSVDIETEYLSAINASDSVNPHEIYDELRKEGPVHRGDVLTDELGMGYSMAAPAGNREVFTFLDFETLHFAYRNSDVFSSTVLQETIGRVQGLNVIQLDPPEHTRHRELLRRAFDKKRLDEWRTHLVGPIVQDLLDQLTPRGAGDLMAELALWLPIRVVHFLLRLPEDQLQNFHKMAVGLQIIKIRPDLATASSNLLAELLGELIRQQRAERVPDTILDDLITARAEGHEPFDDEEILSFMRVLLPAGGETTTRGLGSLLVGLLNDPAQLELLREDRSRMTAAIDEALRWESPTSFTYRIATKDIEVAGVPIPAGSGINLCVAAANRDPARWEDPHTFDITRKPRANVAFGFGAHVCIGMHLARTEMGVAMNEILDRMPGLRVAPGAAAPTVGGTTFRSPSALPVVWNIEHSDKELA